MKRVLLGCTILVVAGFLAFSIFYFNNARPVSNDSKPRNFVINPGDSTTVIASRLEKNGLVRNKYIFLLDVYRLNLKKSLQAGLFKLSPSMTSGEVAAKLSSSGSRDVWIKILDGQRISELDTDFDTSLEGYIFPDSYLVPQDYSVDQIQSIISNNFEKKIAEAKIGSSISLTDREAVILASLIEREARTALSKQKVSGVLLNRLGINMPLQIDATLQYVRDTQKHPLKYWLPVSVADKKIASPYNTYQNPGLPPGPICNPGFDALYAAFHPEKSDYLYYITGNDNQMHFARTLDEHNTNIAKYLK